MVEHLTTRAQPVGNEHVIAERNSVITQPEEKVVVVVEDPPIRPALGVDTHAMVEDAPEEVDNV